MASKRRLRRRAYQTKVQHATQAAAWAHAEHLRRTTGAAYHHYRCAWGHWHVGRMNRSQIQSARARAVS